MTADEKRERRQLKNEFRRALLKNVGLHFPHYSFCATNKQLKQAAKMKADQLAAQFGKQGA